MFENNRDTTIFHGGFISARSILSSKKGEQLSHFIGLSDGDANLAKKIIQDTWNFIAGGYAGSEKNWSRTHRELAMKRIHSALLYKALKCSDISCPQADSFYESISMYLLPLDWRFYLKLVDCLHFNEHFEQCLLQFPKSLLLMLLQWTLKEIKSDSSIAPSILYSVMKIILHKSLSQGRELISREDDSKFDFDFSFICDTVEDCPIDSLSDDVLHLMKQDLGGVNFCGTLLGWMSYLIGYMTDYIVDYEVFLQSNFLQQFLLFIKDYVSSEGNLICAANSVGNSHDFDDYKVLAIQHPMYNMFLIYYHGQELLESLDAKEITNQTLTIIEEIIELLCNVHPFHTRDPALLQHHVKLLVSMIDDKVDGFYYAVELLLRTSELIQKDDVLLCLENNWKLFACNTSALKALLNAGVSEPEPFKTRLVELFNKACKHLSLDIQSVLLEYVVEKHGPTANLKSSSYEEELHTFLNTIVNSEELTALLVPLCIQSIENTIEKIIHHILLHGKSMLIVVQALKSIYTSICYEKSDNTPSVLVKYLQQFFMDKDLTAKQKDHFICFVKEVLQAFDEDSFPLDKFFIYCIQPNLHSQYCSKDVEFTLKVFNALLESSLKRGSTAWLRNIDLTVQIVYFSSFIHYCIISRNGVLKSLVVSLVDSLCEFQRNDPSLKAYFDTAIDKNILQHHLSTLHPVVEFYIWDFIEVVDADFKSANLHDMLCWCVIRHQKAVFFQEQILQYRKDLRHVLLVSSVAQVITHFTEKEFAHLLVIFEELPVPTSLEDRARLCVGDDADIIKDKLWMINLCEVLVDALVLLNGFHGNSLPWGFIITSFSQVIKSCLAVVGSCPLLLAKLFLEACCLCNAMENQSFLKATLLDILNVMKKPSAASTLYKECDLYVGAAKKMLTL